MLGYRLANDVLEYSFSQSCPTPTYTTLMTVVFRVPTLWLEDVGDEGVEFPAVVFAVDVVEVQVVLSASAPAHLGCCGMEVWWVNDVYLVIEVLH